MTQLLKRNRFAAVLNEGQVAQIRQLYEEGKTQRALGEMFEMSTQQIGRIVRGESWRTAAYSPRGNARPLPQSPEAMQGMLERLLQTQAEVEALGTTGIPKVENPLGEVDEATKALARRYLGGEDE